MASLHKVNPRQSPGDVTVKDADATTEPTPLFADDLATQITRLRAHPSSIEGHFCILFTAHHATQGKLALKRLRIFRRGHDTDGVRELLREANTWRDLQHPNVLPFLGSCNINNFIYLVSPYMENGSVMDFIRDHPERADRIALIRQTASALEYLHARGIIHGNVKGANILVSETEDALLCDYGLGNFEDPNMHTTKHGVGSIPWQAPEIWTGAPLSFESDVYAFGMTIAEILTGAPPFNQHKAGAAIMEAVFRHDELPEMTPTTSPEGISYEQLWHVASLCWLREPNRRPRMQTVVQLFQSQQYSPSSMVLPAGSPIHAPSTHQHGANPPSGLVDESGISTLDDLATQITSLSTQRYNSRGGVGDLSTPAATMDSAVDFASSLAALATVPGLAAAAYALCLAYQSVGDVALHRAQCKTLCGRAIEIMIIIRDNAGKADRTELQDTINMVTDAIKQLQEDIGTWAGYGFAGGWHHRHDIDQRIQEHGKHLEECVYHLKLATSLQIGDKTNEIGNGVEEDPQTLNKILPEGNQRGQPTSPRRLLSFLPATHHINNRNHVQPIEPKSEVEASAPISVEIKRDTKLTRLHGAYANKSGKDINSIEEDIPASLSMEKRHAIKVMVERRWKRGTSSKNLHPIGPRWVWTQVVEERQARSTGALTPGPVRDPLEDDALGPVNKNYWRPGDLPNLAFRRVINGHNPPELLASGIINLEDVDKLSKIFYDRLNPLFVPLHRLYAVSSYHYTEKPWVYNVAMHFACVAAAMLVEGPKSVEICQACIIMSVYPLPARRWEEDRSWLSPHLAIGMTTDLALHTPSSTTKFIDERHEREVLNRTRTWIICFNLDRSGATQFGKPPSIKEDSIIHSTATWYKKSVNNHCNDIHTVAYISLRTLAGFMEDDAKLQALRDETAARFAKESDPSDPACKYRSELLPFLNYSCLVVLSFGFQRAFQQGRLGRGNMFLTACPDPASSVLRIVIEVLALSGYLRYAADGHFVFAAFASAFLVKLLRSYLLEHDQQNRILQLITDSSRRSHRPKGLLVHATINIHPVQEDVKPLPNGGPERLMSPTIQVQAPDEEMGAPATLFDNSHTHAGLLGEPMFRDDTNYAHSTTASSTIDAVTRDTATQYKNEDALV
ncbi:hypothetical protein FRB99_002352 [Tulasnella sp. 403]|nr:hypothetical protein FRB99_002352 [Tulasnella sp. 403]